MNLAKSLVGAVVMAASVLVPITAAVAEPCSAEGSAAGDLFDLDVICEQPGSSGEGSIVPAEYGGQPFTRYEWASICTGNPLVNPDDVSCPAALTCPDPMERVWQLWGQLANGSWRTLRTQCFGGVPPEYVPPEVTPDHVLTALRQIGLPALQTHTQPEEKTLVNFDTIFYTDPQTVDLNLTILGQAVHVIATPSSYRWVFGDGQSATTIVPGDPYPAKTIVHRYQDAHVTVQPHVEVSYSARFQVGSQPWQEINETVTITGPPTDLRIAEATAVLSGNHD